uniref:Uncharacterized protein n=1 Tax=Ditylenchus dipsaci TaxID=166011 RepID=A0A915ENC1_9BILA
MEPDVKRSMRHSPRGADYKQEAVVDTSFTLSEDCYLMLDLTVKIYLTKPENPGHRWMDCSGSTEHQTGSE